MPVLVGSLCLSEEDAKEYQGKYAYLKYQKDEAIKVGDKAKAKSCRQAITALYDEYKEREVPQELSDWEKEAALSLEERIERIEEHLNLGKYKE